MQNDIPINLLLFFTNQATNAQKCLSCCLLNTIPRAKVIIFPYKNGRGVISQMYDLDGERCGGISSSGCDMQEVANLARWWAGLESLEQPSFLFWKRKFSKSEIAEYKPVNGNFLITEKKEKVYQASFRTIRLTPYGEEIEIELSAQTN
ncbi:MAG: hypothetical protein WCV58_02955 [Patescibacteria group bacterium]